MDFTLYYYTFTKRTGLNLGDYNTFLLLLRVALMGAMKLP